MKKIADEILNDYIDNQLDDSAINELKQNLNADDESLKKLQALQIVDETLHGMEVYPAPNNFSERVMEKILKQVKSIKPQNNYFFVGVISVFGLVITAVLIAFWNIAEKQDTTAMDIKTFETAKNFISENITLFGNFLHNNQLVFAGASLTIILLLSIIFLFDSHKNFKNKLKSITQ